MPILKGQVRMHIPTECIILLGAMSTNTVGRGQTNYIIEAVFSTSYKIPEQYLNEPLAVTCPGNKTYAVTQK
jgi:hypothetical protein